MELANAECCDGSGRLGEGSQPATCRRDRAAALLWRRLGLLFPEIKDNERLGMDLSEPPATGVSASFEPDTAMQPSAAMTMTFDVRMDRRRVEDPKGRSWRLFRREFCRRVAEIEI